MTNKSRATGYRPNVGSTYKSSFKSKDKRERKYADFGGGVNLPVTVAFRTGGHNGLDLLNLDIKDGALVKRKGFRTFKGMVKELDKLNRNYKKFKAQGDFTIRLPIRGNL